MGNMRCSFCGLDARQRGPLCEGPGQVYICEACAELALRIIEQERRRLGHEADDGSEAMVQAPFEDTGSVIPKHP